MKQTLSPCKRKQNRIPDQIRISACKGFGRGKNKGQQGLILFFSLPVIFHGLQGNAGAVAPYKGRTPMQAAIQDIL